MDRFNLATEEELDLLVEQRHSKATKSVFKVSENLLNQYTMVDDQFSLDELFNDESVSVPELDAYLRRFYANVRKQNGEKYCRKSLTTIRFGLQQLFKKRRDVDIINNDQFKRSRETFKAVLVDVKKEGKGDSKHKDVISDADMKKLYKSKVLSVDTPKGLLNKVFFDYVLIFCNRGRENLRTLKKDDFIENVDATGRKYFTVRTKLTKNRREDDDDFSGSNRMYEDKGNPTCPVASLKLYLSKLNLDNDAFFQRPLSNWSEGGLWYSKQPLGHNTLGSMMQKISEEAHLSKTYTNHCVRATCITILDKNGFESRHIMSISKHKSESSLKHYSARLSDEKRVEASLILNKACNGSDKENINSITDEKDLQAVSHVDIEKDPELLKFLSPSQEDYLLAFSVPTDIMMNTASTSSVQHSLQPASAGNMPNFRNDTTMDMGLYAPFQQLNALPFNLVNYGTVNINYGKQ